MVIKYCMVRNCCNDSYKTPNKLFIRIPVDVGIKESWFKAMNVAPTASKKNSLQFCCEDHFDLQNDAENFIEFKLIGVRLRMKKTIVPHLNLNLNSKTAEESQFTLSAKQLRDTNIKTLQQTVTPEIVLITPIKQETEENFEVGINVKQKISEEQANTNSLLPLVKQQTNESFEDGVTVKEEIAYENFEDQEEQLMKQAFNIKVDYTNLFLLPIKLENKEIFEDDITIKKECITVEDHINEDYVNQDEQLKKQEVGALFVKPEIEEKFEEITIKEECIAVEDHINEYYVKQDKQLKKQELDIDFNNEDNKNALLVKPEIEEKFEETTIKEEFIAAEDYVNQDEQLKKQEVDVDFNHKEDNKNALSVKLETEERFEDVTIKEECVANDARVDFNITEDNPNAALPLVKQEIEENEDEQNVKEESIVREVYLSQELYQQFTNHEPINSLQEFDFVIKDEIEESMLQEEQETEETFTGSNIEFEEEEEESEVDEELLAVYHIEEIRSDDVLDPSNLIRKKRKYESKTVNCSICNKHVFKRKLKHHMKVHTGIKDFKCIICKKQFVHKSYFEQHVLQTHTGIYSEMKKIECSYCKKKYSPYYLESHINLVHLRIKKYECHICNKKLSNIQTLQGHVDKHNGVKYPCLKCNKMYFREYLHYHQKTCRNNFEL